MQAATRYRYRRDDNWANHAGSQVGTDADPCSNNHYGDNDYERHCEVRESTMGAGPLNVDAGQNGGIVIEGWDRNEIRVRAVVQGSASSAARAQGDRRSSPGAGWRRPRVCDGSGSRSA